MLHSSIGEAGNHDHVVLGKRKWLGKIVGEILDSLGRNLLHLCRFFLRALELRTPDVQPRHSRRLVHFSEWPGSKGKQISADGIGFRKSYSLGVAHLC